MKAPNGRLCLKKDERIDIPSRLFWAVTEVMGIDLTIWKTYLDEYIRKLHPDRVGDMDAVRKERSTTIGNTNNTFWFSNSLSFSKLLNGLKIIRVSEVKVTLWVKTEEGEEYTVEEYMHLPKVGGSDK